MNWFIGYLFLLSSGGGACCRVRGGLSSGKHLMPCGQHPARLRGMHDDDDDDGDDDSDDAAAGVDDVVDHAGGGDGEDCDSDVDD